ncbi:MAG: hypothetical protein ACU826_05235, partial [Gammaproteobacteria bacterium]
MKRHSTLYPVLLVLPFLLAGCAAERPAAKPPFPQDVAKAEKMLQSGKPREAAKLYGQLAEKPSGFQNQFRLHTLDSLIKSGDIEEARRYAGGIRPDDLSDEQGYYLNLLRAQISLGSGDAE